MSDKPIASSPDSETNPTLSSTGLPLGHPSPAELSSTAQPLDAVKEDLMDDEMGDDEMIDDEIGDDEMGDDSEIVGTELEIDDDEIAALQQPAATRTPGLYANSLANACVAARIADDLRGQDIVVLDLTEVTSIVDFFVIVTGNSRRQMHAIADEVNRKLKHEDGNRRISIEGYRTEGNWVLTDYGDVVLHVFTTEGRQLYNLEQLWADAKRIDWQSVPVASGPAAKVSSAVDRPTSQESV